MPIYDPERVLLAGLLFAVIYYGPGTALAIWHLLP